MEKPPLPAGGSKANSTVPFNSTLEKTTSTSTSAPPLASSPTLETCRHSNHERGTDTVKAEIMSHPLYPALLRAFIECQKVGAPPEVVGRLSSLAGEVESHSSDGRQDLSDPELDVFMEIYCHMLVRYKHELTRPIQEAHQFYRTMEAQMDSLALDDNVNSCEGGGSSEDGRQETCDVAGLPEMQSPSAEGKELKDHLLNKYSGYLSSLWSELSKRKKKGKLPRDARQRLLHWWQLHYRWPYPSELEKAALAESTGLDAKQINNWFINQRKRHWKPTPPAMEYRSLAHYGAPSSSSVSYRMDGQYFTGGSEYPHGP